MGRRRELASSFDELGRDVESEVVSEHYPQALPKGHRIEEYEIVRVLGAGGFGITYLAFDHNLDGPVALKEYFPREHAGRKNNGNVAALSAGESREIFAWGRDRFIEEARAIHKVSHPNVVRVLRYLKSHGTVYIVMEYVEGKSLTAVLEERRSLVAAEWRPWLEALLDGLAHVHAQGYLHRDITPANIVIRAENGRPVLIDFGAARMAAGERTHTQVLTPAYAPIEQHTSEARQGAFTDIYSLAAVSYRALTGQLPRSAPDRMLNDRHEPLAERVAGADRAWLAVIDRGLGLRPEDRPQAVAAWVAELAKSRGDINEKEDALAALEAERSGLEARLNEVTAAIDALQAVLDVGTAAVPARRRPGRPRRTAIDALQGVVDAVEEHHEAAEHGDADAQFKRGCAYDSGKGAQQNHSKAAEWFRRAADQGDGRAQFNLGHMYYFGEGVEQHYSQAAEWWRKAAEQGDADAQYCLGQAYKFGEGIPKDPVQAHMWCSIAAENGSDLASDLLQDLELEMTPSQITEAGRRARAWMEDRGRG